MSKASDRIQPFLTIENAKIWEMEIDKCVRIIDNILDEAEVANTDRNVELVEKAFDKLLGIK